MTGILIKIKNGHQLNGDGEKLGKDCFGNVYTFWKNNGNMEVPIDVAIRLEKENPQRYEIIDRGLAATLITPIAIPTLTPAIPKKEIPIDINPILDQVEKAIGLNKSEQIALLNKLKIVPDKQGKEFNRVRTIILSGHKL